MKFEWELAHFVDSERQHRRNGILLLRAAFPEFLLAFVNARTGAAHVAFGAVLDYTDYDHSPPSVMLVDPFSEHPLKPSELPAQLVRRMVPLAVAAGKRTLVPMVQPLGQAPTHLCVPGTRHYHEHPAVDPASWLLARTQDGGSLTSLALQLAACVASTQATGAEKRLAAQSMHVQQNGHSDNAQD
jgi:hypothetical protein